MNPLVQFQIEQGKGKKKRLPKPPKWLPPNAIEVKYRSLLVAFAAKLKEIVKADLLPALPNLVEQAAINKPKTDSSDTRHDNWVDQSAQIIEQLKIKMKSPIADLTALLAGIAKGVADWNDAQFQKTMRQIFGVNIFQSEPWLQDSIKAFAKQNATLIQSISDTALTQIDTIMTASLQNGTRSEEIAKQLSDRFGVTASRAKFIARDQISKLNGQLTKQRQQSVGVNQYTWSTAGDERVRPTHASLEGKVFSWDKPPKVGHPGEDYQCRCVAIPLLSNT